MNKQGDVIPREQLARPNIILINADDLGWGDLACTGHPQHVTPNLDRMASEGITFTNFYQGSPICSASRAAMLTGCYPQRVGINGVLFPGEAIGLDSEEETIASMLKTQGYATMIVGKWHCGDQPEFLPTRHGFDHYFGLPYSNDMGRLGGRENYPPLPLLLDEDVVEAQPDQAALTSRYLEHSLRFIRENRVRPFFLYFAHMYVHLPLYVPRRFEAESKNGSYGAAVACIDWAAGVLLAELKALGIDEDTLVIFTSDNGSRCDFGRSNGHLRGTKNTCWEGGMRVPFLARWPGSIPAGRRSNAMLTGMDILPSLAKLCGTAPSGDRRIDGIDVADLIVGRTENSSRDTYFYYRLGGLYAVRKGKWKRVVASFGYVDKSGLRTGLDELYDIEDDPGEINNIVDANRDVAEALDELLAACRIDLGDDLTGAKGKGIRPSGIVADPKPLTTFDPSHPYYMAMYDLGDLG